MYKHTDPLNLSVQGHKSEMLMVGLDNKIDLFIFDAIDQTVEHQSVDGKRQEEKIDFRMLANACLVYGILKREQRIINRDIFYDDICELLRDNISRNLTNPDEVALALIRSWQTLAQKREFINNVAAGRVTVTQSQAIRGGLTLQTIPNFLEFMNGLITAYLNTVVNEREIQAWAITQSLELFLSIMDWRPFNRNKFHQYIQLEERINICCDLQKQTPNSNDTYERFERLKERVRKTFKFEWFHSLKASIERLMADSVTNKDRVQRALQYLYEMDDNEIAALHDIDCLSCDNEIKNLLKESKIVKPLLDYLLAEIDSSLYTAITQGDSEKPSLEVFRQGIRYALSSAAKKHDISLIAKQEKPSQQSAVSPHCQEVHRVVPTYPDAISPLWSSNVGYPLSEPHSRGLSVTNKWSLMPASSAPTSPQEPRREFIPFEKIDEKISSNIPNGSGLDRYKEVGKLLLSLIPGNTILNGFTYIMPSMEKNQNSRELDIFIDLPLAIAKLIVGKLNTIVSGCARLLNTYVANEEVQARLQKILGASGPSNEFLNTENLKRFQQENNNRTCNYPDSFYQHIIIDRNVFVEKIVPLMQRQGYVRYASSQMVTSNTTLSTSHSAASDTASTQNSSQLCSPTPLRLKSSK